MLDKGISFVIWDNKPITIFSVGTWLIVKFAGKRRSMRVRHCAPIEKSRLTAQEILPSQSRAFGGSSCLFATAQR